MMPHKKSFLLNKVRLPGTLPASGESSSLKALPQPVPQPAELASQQLTPPTVMQLQRRIGNRAVGQFFNQARSLGIQPKLRVGPANDQYEQEADQVAQQIVGKSEPAEADQGRVAATLQRQGGEGGFEAGDEIESRIAAQRGSGQPLPLSVRAQVESRLGANFRGVRVHTDAEADSLNQSLNADAFTTGQDIFFRRGGYNPTSAEGQTLLAHELTHVAQQNGKGGGAVAPLGQGVGNMIQCGRRKARKAGSTYWIYLVQRAEWVQATLVNIYPDQGYEFRVKGEKELVWIAAEKYIRDEKPQQKGEKGKKGEQGQKRGKKRKKETYFDKTTFYRTCQYPGCGETFESEPELYEHIRQSHEFPQQEFYPYALFGGQNASSHLLKKSGESQFEYDSRKTGEGFHSEFRGVSEMDLPRKKRKLNKKKKKSKEKEEPEEFSSTTNISDFMSLEEEAPQSLFLTGEPHCGLCSLTFKHSHLPLTYPTNAQPSQSQGYFIPRDIAESEEVKKLFRGEPNYQNRPESLGYGREQFPGELQTREDYNKNLKIENESIKKKDELAYKRYMLQAMALNKNRYERFFGSLDFSQPFNREKLKKSLSEHPIPEHPETFDFYMPSPLREDPEVEGEKEMKKQAQAKIIEGITQAFQKLRDQTIKVKEGGEFLDPLRINNCLITAMNGGVGASPTQVTLIRYLLFQEMDIPYGDMLTAQPEVIYTIATTLGVRNLRLVINSPLGQQQEFLIQNDGTVVELEGDEAEELPNLSVLTIKHDGEDHFEFESLV